MKMILLINCHHLANYNLFPKASYRLHMKSVGKPLEFHVRTRLAQPDPLVQAGAHVEF